MKLDYAKAFKDIFKNSDLKSTFLITVALYFIGSLLFLYTGKEIDVPLSIKLASLLGYLALMFLSSGYSLQISHNGINNKIASLPEYKDNLGKYFLNGIKFTGLLILLALILLIASLPLLFISGFIMSTSNILTKISFITIFGLILAPYLISITLFLQVIKAQFAENFIFSKGFALIRAIKFLYKNITSYLKVYGITFLLYMATVIIIFLPATILGFILAPILKNYFINIKILFKILGYIIATPLMVYISIVMTNLYAQIYRLGSTTEQEEI